ncbi:major capsid protein [Snodgrassella alvi]|nr:major capsid protein [Snodgrassella alvi]
MTIEEQINAVKAKIKENRDLIAKTVGEAVEKGLTPSEEQEAVITKAEDEIKVLERNLARLEKNHATANLVAETTTPAKGDTVAEGVQSTAGNNVTVKSNLPKGIGFAQFARAKMIAALEAKKGNYISPAAAAKNLGFSEDVIKYIEKATLGTTTDGGFAAPLVERDTFHGEFIELLRNETIFDKLKGYRSVPFNVKINGQATGGSASWVGEGKKKPLTNPTFESIEIKEHKLAAITVYTQELIRRADPAIDKLVLDDLLKATAALIDDTFLSNGTQTDNAPAGMLFGVTTQIPTGKSASDYEKDILGLLQTFIEKNLSADGSYLIMSETRAMQIAILRDALGNTYFPGMSLNGARNLLGIPVVTSQIAGNKIILIKMSEILVAQDGGVDVSYSDQATLIDGDKTHNLWQENKFAVRVEKFITWAKRRPIAAAFLDYTSV